MNNVISLDSYRRARKPASELVMQGRCEPARAETECDACKCIIFPRAACWTAKWKDGRVSVTCGECGPGSARP